MSHCLGVQRGELAEDLRLPLRHGLLRLLRRVEHLGHRPQGARPREHEDGCKR